jgi:hypothetical protein
VLRSTASRKPKPGVPIEVHDEEPDDDDDASERFRRLAACCEEGWNSADDALHHIEWLAERHTIDHATLESVEAALKAWTRVAALVVEKRGATLPPEPRSELPVDDPTPEFDDIPSELDRRKKRA